MESRSPNTEHVIEDFPPRYHHGGAQQEERPTAEAVLMTFSPPADRASPLSSPITGCCLPLLHSLLGAGSPALGTVGLSGRLGTSIW